MKPSWLNLLQRPPMLTLHATNHTVTATINDDDPLPTVSIANGGDPEGASWWSQYC